VTTNVFMELIEDLRDIVENAPDRVIRGRVERALNRACGIRTYYEIEAKGAAEERSRIVKWLRECGLDWAENYADDIESGNLRYVKPPKD
jgi:hypothetical protein